MPGPADDGGRWDRFHRIAAEFSGPRPHFPDVAAALTAAGFTDVRATGIAVSLPVADPGTAWDFHLSHGFAARVDALSPDDAAAFRRRALAELTRMHGSGGIVLDRGAVVHRARA